MPPKVKITKKEIIEAAIDIIRRNGEGSLNARSIAASIGCSTQPIFSNFESMEDLQEHICATSYEIYLGFLEKEAKSDKYPRYKAFGMGYIRFAEEEKELFKLLFMCDRKGERPNFTVDFTDSVEMIMKMNNVSREKAELIHLEIWISIHGIATMLATSFISFNWDFISDMVSDVYHGILLRHLTEEK